MKTIYADPDLAAEYTAGAWAAALAAHRRTSWMAVFVLVVLLPLGAGAYVLGFSQRANAQAQLAQAVAAGKQDRLALESFRQLDSRMQAVEAEAAANPTVPPVPAVVVVPAPAPAPVPTSAPAHASVAPAPAPPAPAPAATTTTTAPPKPAVSACLLNICLAVGNQ